MKRPSKKRLTLATKINGLIIALILLTSIGITVFNITGEISKQYSSLLFRGDTIVSVVSRNCETGLSSRNVALLLNIITTLDIDPDIAYLVIMDGSKKVLAERSFKLYAPVSEATVIPVDASSIRSSRVSYRDLFLAKDRKRYIEMLSPVETMAGSATAARTVGYIRLGINLEGLYATVRQVLVSSVLFTCLTVCLGIAFGLALTKRMTRPINALMLATQSIAEGRLDDHIQIATNDEISDLSESFNDMLGRLRDYHRQVGQQTAELLSTNKRMAYEIAEKEAAEAALKESEERYALAAKGANDGLWDWDLKNDTIYFSPRWKEMLGLREEEIGSLPAEWLERVHPDDWGQLTAAINYHVQGKSPALEGEYRIRHKDGSYLWMLCRGIAVRGEDGAAFRMAGSQTDITSRKNAEEQLIHDAFHDGLTGLPNRALFLEGLKMSIFRKKRRKNYLFGVLFLDLDRFKNINDSLGHMVGDMLLTSIAQRIRGLLRPDDIMARLGGDEFAILIDDIGGIGDAQIVSERIHMELSGPFTLAGHEVFINGSIGIALSSDHYENPEEILRDADTAMYEAKMRGKGCYAIFDSTMHAKAVALMKMETDMRRAIERGEFILHYQPIIHLETGNIAGFEALVRWMHPERGLVPPADFIPFAEETGLIPQIGDWVIKEACNQLKKWHALFPAGEQLTMSVNISGKQFAQPDFIVLIGQIIEEAGLDPSCLKVEITESIIIDNLAYSAELLSLLRDLNVQVLIDDFGTGYSSLSYLQSLPITALKIDRTFVSRIGTEGENALILVRAIVSLAHSLGMAVVVEGIETEAQMEVIRKLSCEYAQGYFFFRPMDLPSIEALLQERLLSPSH